MNEKEHETIKKELKEDFNKMEKCNEELINLKKEIEEGEVD